MGNTKKIILPKGWKWVRLGESLTRKPQYGLTAQSTKEPQGFRYIRISDITDSGNLKNDDPRFVALNDSEFSKYCLLEGDILIARSGTVGRIYLHENSQTKSVFASYLIRFKLNQSKILPKFFFYYGLSSYYKKFIDDTLKVVAQPNINAQEYSNLLIPLPPLSEQKRIVEKIEALFSKINLLKELNQKSLSLSKSLLPSALYHTFSNPEKKGWKWVKLEEICRVFSGSSAPQNKKYFENGKYPFVRVQDLGSYGKTNYLSEIKDCLNDLALKECGLVKAEKGTILFPKSGAAILTNSRAILGIDAFIVSHLAALQPNKNLALTEFIYFWLFQIDMADYIENPSYPFLKLSTIKQIPIPLPPLSEQKRIVSYLEKIQQKSQALISFHTQIENQLNNLTSSILSKAFRGELC